MATISIGCRPGQRTTVAPCIGGPHDGDLVRADWTLTSLLIPEATLRGLVYNHYLQETDADGFTIWRFVPSVPYVL